jgi:hypothetical protein
VNTEPELCILKCLPGRSSRGSRRVSQMQMNQKVTKLNTNLPFNVGKNSTLAATLLLKFNPSSTMMRFLNYYLTLSF